MSAGSLGSTGRRKKPETAQAARRREEIESRPGARGDPDAVDGSRHFGNFSQHGTVDPLAASIVSHVNACPALVKTALY